METGSAAGSRVDASVVLSGLRGPTLGHEANRRLAVLVIDDVEADAQLMVEMLEAPACPGFQAEVAGSIAAAKAALACRAFAVILLDLGLPDADGIDGVHDILRIAPQVPIVVVSGNEDEELALRAIEHGAQDYLVKGRFDPDHLVHALRYAVERSKLLVRLDASQERLQAVVDQTADGIVVLNHRHEVLFANDRAVQMLGEDLTAFPASPWGELIECGTCREVQLEPRKGGSLEPRFVELSASAIDWDGVPAVLISIHDSTKTKRLTDALASSNRRLQQVALLDPLTAMYNRRGFGRAMEAELAKAGRAGYPVSALLVDCDDFKRVNDEHGHAVGDAVLRFVARQLRASCRRCDVVARIGGDEFVILLPRSDLQMAVTVGERIRLTVASQAMQYDADSVSVTVSLGASELTYDTASVSEVLALTHVSLKDSKRQGKNCVTSAAGGPVGDRFEQWLTRPDFDQSLSVVWQPIVRVSDESVVGHELLIRGPREIVESPVELFGLARERGFLHKVDIACLIACLRTASRLRAQGLLHVNIFPSVLLEVQLGKLIELFERVDVRGDLSICLEINEQEHIEDLQPLRERIHLLKEKGVRVALDDVGTAFGTLDTVIALELDQIKLDRCMVAGASRDAALGARLERTVRSMKALGSELIAEGVEDRNDLELLRRLGVDYAQGFLWAKPAAGPFVAGELLLCGSATAGVSAVHQ